MSDAPQRSRRQPSRNLPPALLTVRPRSSDLRGQQVDGKARGGDTGARQCPRVRHVDLRFQCQRSFGWLPPETIDGRFQASGQCCVLTTVVWALGLIPVFHDGVSSGLGEHEILAPSARSEHEQGISPNT